MKSFVITSILACVAFLPKLALADTCAAPGTGPNGAPSISLPLLMVAIGIVALVMFKRNRPDKS